MLTFWINPSMICVPNGMVIFPMRGRGLPESTEQGVVLRSYDISVSALFKNRFKQDKNFQMRLRLSQPSWMLFHLFGFHSNGLVTFSNYFDIINLCRLHMTGNRIESFVNHLGHTNTNIHIKC